MPIFSVRGGGATMCVVFRGLSVWRGWGDSGFGFQCI